MKKALIVLMTAALLVSCMPLMAFADTPADIPISPSERADTSENPPAKPTPFTDPTAEEIARVTDAQLRAITMELRELATNEKVLEYYDLVSGIIDTYKPVLDELSENLKKDPESAEYKAAMDQLAGYTAILDEYIINLRNTAADAAISKYKENEEAQAAVAKLKDALVVLDAYINKYDPDYSKDYEEDVKALLDAVLTAEGDVTDAEFRALLKDSFVSFIAESKELGNDLKDDLFTKENLAKFLAEETTYQYLAEIVKKIDTDAVTKALQEQAQKIFNRNSKEVEDADTKLYQNAVNVTNAQPTLSKVKAKKGHKAVVTFKGLKDAEATGYQVSYKTGKKTKTVTVKTATTSDAAVKCTLKKLKKGKKYTVKVRAYYEFQSKGESYKVMSQWSKAKKAKAK